MEEKIILEASDRDKIFLMRTLSLDETVKVLDILRRVDGLTFDFHKTLYPKGEKKDEIHNLVQETYKKFISKNSKIPSEAIGYVRTYGSQLLASTSSYPLEVRYSFGNKSIRTIVESQFSQGYARVVFEKSNHSSAIVSFDEIHRVDKSRGYVCKLNNISNAMKIHSEKSSEIITAEKYQSNLYNLLEGKLLVPEFLTYNHLD